MMPLSYGNYIAAPIVGVIAMLGSNPLNERYRDFATVTISAA
jgi:hypothetical protein